jgi:hypothetical protein
MTSFVFPAEGQDRLDSFATLPAKYVEEVKFKAAAIESKVDDASQKALSKFQKQEKKIFKKISKLDSTAAAKLVAESKQKYQLLQSKLKSNQKFTKYIPGLDTLSTSLDFIKSKGVVKDINQVDETINKIRSLESQLQKAEEIKLFFKERKQMLKQQLEKFGFVKRLKKLNKQFYYYNQQIKEYTALLNDKKKIERKAIELLTRSKQFQDFMKRNSFLARLFPMQQVSSGGTPAGFASLQTRSQLNTYLQQIGIGAPNPVTQLQQNAQSATDYVAQLRNKLNQLIGQSSGELEQPDFKPNTQKTKSFYKRLEFGINIQSQGTNNFLPATTDLGASVGYKLNDKSIIGIGGSYKIGWGKGWDSINISSQGIGFRSFIDWRIKKDLYISGGYEQNYFSAFKNFDQLRGIDKWQKSGLLGLTKSFTLKSKLFKTTKFQMLWDFLSYSQRPRPTSFRFRIGYNF